MTYDPTESHRFLDETPEVPDHTDEIFDLQRRLLILEEQLVEFTTAHWQALDAEWRDQMIRLGNQIVTKDMTPDLSEVRYLQGRYSELDALRNEPQRLRRERDRIVARLASLSTAPEEVEELA